MELGKLPWGWKKYFSKHCPQCGDHFEVTDKHSSHGNRSLHLFEDKWGNTVRALYMFSEPKKLDSISLSIRFDPGGMEEYGYGKSAGLRLHGPDNPAVSVSLHQGKLSGSWNASLIYTRDFSEGFHAKFLKSAHTETWYSLGLKNINYVNSTFDLYFEGRLVEADLSFTKQIAGISGIRLKGEDAHAYFDNLVVKLRK